MPIGAPGYVAIDGPMLPPAGIPPTYDPFTGDRSSPSALPTLVDPGRDLQLSIVAGVASMPAPEPNQFYEIERMAISSGTPADFVAFGTDPDGSLKDVLYLVSGVYVYATGLDPVIRVTSGLTLVARAFTSGVLDTAFTGTWSIQYRVLAR